MPEIMSDTRVDRTDVPDTSADGQLVVDLPQLDQVTGRLAQLNVRPHQPPEVDEALGLALLRLPPGTDVPELAGRLGSADFAAVPVIGTNPHLGVVASTINPYPETKPHSYPLHPYPETKPHPHALTPGVVPRVQVGMLGTRFVESRSPSPLGDHNAFVRSLILDQAPDATVTVRDVPATDGLVTAWDAVRELMALADAGAQVIHLSLACRTADGAAPLLLARAVGLLSSRAVLVAADAATGSTWPAALSGVVACTVPVGLIIDLALPVPPLDGTSLNYHDRATWSLRATWSGTAFAAATVSGAIAARTVPGQVDASDALAALLAEGGGVVRTYAPGNDGQRA